LILNKPIPPDSVRRMLAALPRMERQKVRARLPLLPMVCTTGGKQFTLRSLNISESGMLLQASVPLRSAGSRAAIPDCGVRAVLDVQARIVRKEGDARLAAEFIGLSAGDLNGNSPLRHRPR